MGGREETLLFDSDAGDTLQPLVWSCPTQLLRNVRTRPGENISYWRTALRLELAEEIFFAFWRTKLKNVLAINQDHSPFHFNFYFRHQSNNWTGALRDPEWVSQLAKTAWTHRCCLGVLTARSFPPSPGMTAGLLLPWAALSCSNPHVAPGRP